MEFRTSYSLSLGEVEALLYTALYRNQLPAVEGLFKKQRVPRMFAFQYQFITEMNPNKVAFTSRRY